MTDTHWWSDDPVVGIDQDRFGRTPFAQLFAQTIDSVPLRSASTVFGLVGPWGSGKSSVASMVAEILPESWVVQRFTPWAASGVAGLQLEFVAALDAALGAELAQEQAVRERLATYVAWVRPVISALAGGPLGDAANAAAERIAARKPWSAEYGQLADSLAAMKKRVLIVCDDIDRLDATELLEFLKVVRLLGRFPNIHYLVAYDSDTVEDLLAAAGVGARSASFMEKIVQHPFELPRIDYATRWGHIREALMRAVGDSGVRLEDAGLERSRLLTDVLTEGLETPRQIARYEQHLNVLATLVHGEVDFLDFAAAAYLRLNHHEVYEALPEWTPQLRKGLSADSAKGALSEGEWQQRVADTSRRDNTTGAWSAIGFLFPGLRPSAPGSRHPQAFSDPQYQERYYSLGVPQNDVSDVLIARTVRSFVARRADEEAEQAFAAILDGAHPSVARLAIKKLDAERSRTAKSGDSVVRLIEFLTQCYERFKPTEGEAGSPAAPVLTFLGEEVLRGYTAGQIDRGWLLRLLGESRAFDLVLDVASGWGSNRDDRKVALLKDFTQFAVESLSKPGTVIAEPADRLRTKVALLWRETEEADLQGWFDWVVAEDVVAFEALAVAMVGVTTWHGPGTSRGELEFDGPRWTTLISEDIRQRMAAQLTSEFDGQILDEYDVSEENRRQFAIRAVRAELKVDPGGK